MKNLYKTITLILFLTMLLIASSPVFGESFKHVNDLFKLRDSITEQGNFMPAHIRKANGNNIRTLERIFERNTSVLVTIESYFRLVMMAVSTDSETNTETVKILNNWLNFIKNQCGYDLEYLNTALAETTDETTKKEVQTAINNTERLSEISEKGIQENMKLLE